MESGTGPACWQPEGAVSPLRISPLFDRARTQLIEAVYGPVHWHGGPEIKSPLLLPRAPTDGHVSLGMEARLLSKHPYQTK